MIAICSDVTHAQNKIINSIEMVIIREKRDFSFFLTRERNLPACQFQYDYMRQQGPGKLS
jgi:hypothetical protein